MRTLIIRDKKEKSLLGGRIINKVVSLLQNRKISVKELKIDENDLAGCSCCFKCIVDTVGNCSKDDMGKIINDEFMKSDLVILVTPIKDSCYSTVIKRVLDRTIATLYLDVAFNLNNKIGEGGTDKYPKIIIVGYKGSFREVEKELFYKSVGANTINFQAKKAKCYVCSGVIGINKMINKMDDYIDSICDWKVYEEENTFYKFI